MSDPDISQRFSGEQMNAQRLTTLEKAVLDLAKTTSDLGLYRERMETRWGLIAAFVGTLGGIALISAFVTRDTVRDTSARVTAIESRVAVVESDRGRRDTDDRASSAAIVRLQTTVDAMQHSLDARLGAIESRLSQDDRTPHR